MTLLRNVFIDIFVGLIPYAGIVLDIFYKSYRENTILIEGFVNDDPNIVKKSEAKGGLYYYMARGFRNGYLLSDCVLMVGGNPSLSVDNELCVITSLIGELQF